MGDFTLHSSFVNRWRHRGKLVFRVWPKYKEGQLLVVSRSRIPVVGLSLDAEGRMRAVHYVGGKMKKGGQPRYFELSDADAETLAAAADAGAELDFSRAFVRAPGTLDNRVKKECWLEVPFVAYGEAPPRTKTAGGAAEDRAVPLLRNISGHDMEADVRRAGYEFRKLLLVEDEEDLDEDLVCREVVERGALVVFPRAAAGRSWGRRIDALISRAKYWVVPGRRPGEDGGIFRGYQFCDRFVRWNRTFAPGERAAATRKMLEMAHAATREKGRTSRRVYFTERVINGFAERAGVPRQRVASRFLDDGVVDWMVRSVDGVRPVPMRETSALLCGRVKDAVEAIAFYYRAAGALGGEAAK